MPYLSFANGEHFLCLWCSPGVHEHLHRRWWQTRICCLPGATRGWRQGFAATGEAFPSAQNLDVFHILAEFAKHGPAHSWLSDRFFCSRRILLVQARTCIIEKNEEFWEAHKGSNHKCAVAISCSALVCLCYFCVCPFFVCAPTPAHASIVLATRVFRATVRLLA